MPKQTQNITIRVPVELFDKLAAAAASDHRSISSQVVHYLERILSGGKPDEQKAAAGHDK